ncbi:YTH domain-containing family protein 1 isoform X2 [Phlebotomus argentipes]|uniref:YTH domain-containing family protein 1 isoform X2 n=1 Tax=Phlebotomus argentipes TaxID=94469 RepID=UPI002893013B|nr:YTH domain-containing family protein 1 isoform X2 [Phlebotomus argentipes]
MSAGVSDQRMKGQGNQGAQFQYPPFGVSDGTWSSGNENLAILGGYSAAHDNYGVDMFGPSFGQQSSYNYFPGNGDYNTWGSQQVNANAGGPQQQQQQQPPPPQQQQQPPQRKHYDDYYRDQAYAHDSLKAMEQGMQGLGLEMAGGQHHDKEATSNSVNSKASHHDHPSHQPKESVPKKMTWASVASQPAKPQVNTTTLTVKKKGPGMPPPPMVPGKHNLDIGTWDSPSKNGPLVPPPVVTAPPPPVVPSPLVVNNQKAAGQPSASTNHPGMGPPPPQMHQNMGPPPPNDGPNNQSMRPAWSGPNRPPMQGHPGMGMPPPPHQRSMGHGSHGGQGPPPMMMSGGYQGPPPSHQQAMPPPPASGKMPPPSPSAMSASGVVPANVLEKLRDKNNYNPLELDLDRVANARFFVIKSYSEDDIHRSIKYEIWCSTEHGNKRLDQAFRERERETGVVYLFFSVNGSGHFCGIAQMLSNVDYNSNSSVWSQDKWKGTFKVKWVYVKDVPNMQLRHIRLENNENKSVTHSRDTQEVPHAKGIQVYKIIHAYKHTTSIFDDFIHYEKRQEEEDSRKHVEPPPNQPYERHFGNHNSPYDKPHHGYERGGGGGGYDKPPMKSYSRGGGYDGKQQYSNYDNRRPPPPPKDHYDGGYHPRDPGQQDYNSRNNNREPRPMERHDSGGSGGGGYNHRDGGRGMGHREHHRGGRGSGGGSRGHRN